MPVRLELKPIGVARQKLDQAVPSSRPTIADQALIFRLPGTG
jgi:hypothetical protein